MCQPGITPDGISVQLPLAQHVPRQLSSISNWPFSEANAVPRFVPPQGRPLSAVQFHPAAVAFAGGPPSKTWLPPSRDLNRTGGVACLNPGRAPDLLGDLDLSWPPFSHLHTGIREVVW